MVKLNFIKSIEILSSTFSVVWDKQSNAGSFSWTNSQIKIGIKSYKQDALYTFSILSHELMEVILCGMGARWDAGRMDGNWLFNFNHQTFENAIEIHSQVLSKFIKWSK